MDGGGERRFRRVHNDRTCLWARWCRSSPTWCSWSRRPSGWAKSAGCRSGRAPAWGPRSAAGVGRRVGPRWPCAGCWRTDGRRRRAPGRRTLARPRAAAATPWRLPTPVWPRTRPRWARSTEAGQRAPTAGARTGPRRTRSARNWASSLRPATGARTTWTASPRRTGPGAVAGRRAGAAAATAPRSSPCWWSKLGRRRNKRKL